MLEATADRTRRLLPMYTTGPRAPDRITVGLTAIGRKIAGAISGWLGIGRDVRINTIRLAVIGIGIVTTTVDAIGTGIVTTRVGAMGIETVDFASDGNTFASRNRAKNW